MKNIQTKRNLEFGIAKNEQLNTSNKKTSNIILYSNGCHKGKVLKNLLNMLQIKYTEITEIEEIEEKRFIPMPILEVDDNIMNFLQAIKWIHKNKGRKFFD